MTAAAASNAARDLLTDLETSMIGRADSLRTDEACQHPPSVACRSKDARVITPLFNTDVYCERT